ncbi:subtilisin-like serine protease [Apiospora arundinis]
MLLLVPRDHVVHARNVLLALLGDAAVLVRRQLRLRVVPPVVEGLVRHLHGRAAERVAGALDALDAGLDVVDELGHFE